MEAVMSGETKPLCRGVRHGPIANIVRKAILVIARGAFLLGVLTFLPAHSASAVADVTQARYMTPSEVMKYVSLTMHGEGDSLNEHLSADQAREYILNALANRAIAVRPNSAVALEVTLSHERRSTVNTDEAIVRHDYFLTLQFFVRGAVWRNGNSMCCPWRPQATYVLEPKELQRLLLNAETGRGFAQQFAQGVVNSLNVIDASTTVDTTPFPLNSWTDKEKVQGHTDFAKAMRADAPMDTSLILDLRRRAEIQHHVKI